jgi:hypothetical protein
MCHEGRLASFIQPIRKSGLTEHKGLAAVTPHSSGTSGSKPPYSPTILGMNVSQEEFARKETNIGNYKYLPWSPGGTTKVGKQKCSSHCGRARP